MASLTQEEQDIFSGLIERYRDLVEERYTFSKIQKIFPTESEITEEVVTQIREFFINDVYPSPQERVKLDKAFANLRTYMYKPSKIWRLMGNMTSAIFEFGRLFPKALKTGVKALKSYLDAKDFESCILKASKELNISMPVTSDDFYACLRQIPQEKSIKLMNDVMAMFVALTNDKLVSKTIQILAKVITKMQQYPETYPKEDILGIEQGISLLKNGYLIFSGFSPKLKKAIIDVMAVNEQNFIDEIYLSIK